MATAAKKAPAKAAAKKPAPAPAVEVNEVDNEEGSIEEGSEVRFLGYGADTPEDQHILTEGEVYTVVGFIEPDGDDPGGDPIVRAPNPNFNPKKKEHPESNAKTIDVQVFADELEAVDALGDDEDDEDSDGTDAEEQEDEQEEEAPPPVAAKKGKAAPAKEPAKGASKEKTKVAAAKKGKAAPTKTATKVAPKGKAKAKGKDAGEEEDKDEVPELENEDADVLAIVDGSEDLIASAQDLDDQVAQNEYTIGGLLYHIKKDKLHHEILGEDGNPLYAGKGGWATFLVDHFKMEYRKAQWLLEVYVHFTLAGIENPAEVVARIGYTKAKTIAKELTKEDANVADLIELASTNSAADLSTAIKESEHVGGTKGEKKSKMTLRLRYYEADAKTVESILGVAMEQYGLKDIGEALLQVVTEWAAERGGSKPTKEAAPAQRVNGSSGSNGKKVPAKAAAKRVSAVA